ncbi:MAG: glycosyltransferase family 4 protein [Pyrinomonadaceae bacterium]
MKTVLHFIQDGDTSGIFPNLAKWHDKTKYRVLFASLGHFDDDLKEEMESYGVNCFSCDAETRIQYPLAIARLSRYLRSEKVDILHVHLFFPSVVGLIAGKMSGIKARVMTRHYSNYHTRINKSLHVKIDQICNKFSRRIIGVSKHTSEHIIDAEGESREKVVTIYNGIDFDRVKNSCGDFRERIRSEFDANRKFLILTTGRLHPEKGYPYLFEAVAKLKKLTDKPFVWLIAGKGPLEAEFRQRVSELGCDDVIKFIGFRKDIPDLMSTADVFVLPSVAEAFGVVFAEAIYLGVPIVATKIGGIPEIVTDEVDGILIPPADSDAIAKTVVDLINNPEKLESLKYKGREKVIGKFEFEDMTRQYEAVYDDLVKNG